MRLRANRGKISNFDPKIFQFLLVRLRGETTCQQGKRIIISIPSGAIKREFCVNATPATDDISIPSGAIKSTASVFRMKRYIVISIPSGAIKRILTLRRNSGLRIFQFLLVRLRAINHSSRHVQTYISIPSGAIKRKWICYTT